MYSSLKVCGTEPVAGIRDSRTNDHLRVRKQRLKLPLHGGRCVSYLSRDGGLKAPPADCRAYMSTCATAQRTHQLSRRHMGGVPQARRRLTVGSKPPFTTAYFTIRSLIARGKPLRTSVLTSPQRGRRLARVRLERLGRRGRWHDVCSRRSRQGSHRSWTGGEARLGAAEGACPAKCNSSSWLLEACRLSVSARG